jgi:hypothetical protein
MTNFAFSNLFLSQKPIIHFQLYFGLKNFQAFKLKRIKMIENIAFVIGESLIAIVTVIGNLFVIIAFIKEKKLRKRRNFYIASLAVADFLVGLLSIPLSILVSISDELKNVSGFPEF